MLKIGVLMPCPVDDVGEYLADARALEAASADSIWVDRESGPDPWMLLAGIAVVTGRVRLGITITPADVNAPEVLSQRLAALQRLSRDRGMVRIGPVTASLDDVIALVRRSGGEGLPIVLEATEEKEYRRVARLAGANTPLERWTHVAQPDSRAGWKEMRRSCEDMGVTGVIVPYGPRLLDILRRPDEEDDRSDLLIAQG